MAKVSSAGRKIVLLLVLVVAACGVYLFLQYKQTHVSTEDAYITNDIYWVHPRIAGAVKRVFVKNNTFVKKGDALVAIDDKPYRIKLKAAEARVAYAKARMGEIKAQIASIRAKINLAEAKFDKTTWDFNRAKKLYRQAVMSRDKYEFFLTEYRVAKAEVNSLKAALKQAEAAFRSAQRALEEAQAAYDGARLDLSYTVVRAPSSGYVTKKQVEKGSFVSPQTPVCALVPDRGAWIVANYKESQINKIHPGERVDITIDAYPDKHFKGRVESLQFGTGEVFSLFPPENASGNWIKVTQRIPVKIVFDKPPSVPLRVGMSTRVVVLIRKKPHGLPQELAFKFLKLLGLY